MGPTTAANALAQAEDELLRARSILDEARSVYFAAKAAVSHLRRETMSPVEVAILDIGRKRYRQFAKLVIRYMGEGHDVGDSMRLAVPNVFPSRQSKESVARKAREMASRPEICAAINSVFEEAKFPIQDVAKRHIELIRSSDPKIAYKAIREYWRLVLPRSSGSRF
jgi:hypothetical protein